MTQQGKRSAARLVRIRGRVQGVWFRGWTEREAARLGLSGWVRNRADGSVEALFIGSEPAVADIIAACRHGPPHARVTRIDEQPYDEDDADADWPKGFETRPTL